MERWASCEPRPQAAAGAEAASGAGRLWHAERGWSLPAGGRAGVRSVGSAAAAPAARQRPAQAALALPCRPRGTPRGRLTAHAQFGYLQHPPSHGRCYVSRGKGESNKVHLLYTHMNT